MLCMIPVLAGLAATASLRPLLRGCPSDSSIICSTDINDKDQQYCTHPNHNSSENYGNDFSPIPLYTDCQNTTFSPEYPITNRCENTLKPYDPENIPDGCGGGECIDLDMTGVQWWVMCTGWKGGLGFRSTGMECPGTEEEQDTQEPDEP